MVNRLFSLILFGLLPACVAQEPIALPERFITPSREADNVDSSAIFQTSERVWAIVTAKATDKLLIYDAVSGEAIREFGETGTGPLQFRRPNGILVLDDLMLVTERDNHRVQVISLPELKFVAFIGAEQLHKPYGLSAYRKADGTLRLYVTDDHEAAGGREADPAIFRERVRLFELQGDAKGLKLLNQRSFGETEGAGRLYKVESILADVANDRLFVCDEQGPTKGVKIYDLEGRFTGKTLDQLTYGGEPEGLALIPTSERGGLLISTDQQPTVSIFNVLDRETLKPLYAFKGGKTANTDGICVYPQPLPGLPHGGMWAIHDDQALVGFDLALVLEKAKAGK